MLRRGPQARYHFSWDLPAEHVVTDNFPSKCNSLRLVFTRGAKKYAVKQTEELKRGERKASVDWGDSVDFCATLRRPRRGPAGQAAARFKDKVSARQIIQVAIGSYSATA